MSKTRSKIKLCIVAILTVIGLLLTFTSFVIPTTNTTFRGFFNAINFGYDIGGGRLSVYEASYSNLDYDEVVSKLDETVKRYNNAFGSEGLVFTRHGETIRVEVSNYDNSDLSNLFSMTGSSYDLFDLIGGDKGLSINTDSSNYDAEGSITTEYFLNCEVGGSLVGQDSKNVYPVTINLTEEGQKKLKEMTQNLVDDSSSSTKNIYLYINGNNYNSSGFEISSAVSTLTLYSSSSLGAKVLALQVNALAKPINLNKILDDTVTGGLNTGTGSFFGSLQSMLIFVLLLMFVATIIFFVVRYRMLGLLATVSFLIFISIYAFLLQSIPFVLVDFSGLIGILFTFGLLISGMISIFEKIRSEYASGKKIPNSVTSGFSKNVLKILEKYIFLIIISAILCIVASGGVMSFAICLLIGLFVNYFVLFVALRGMCLSYVNINSIKKSFYNLRREGVKNAK